jgi:hypothetical protein
VETADTEISDEHVEELNLLQRALKALMQRSTRLVIGEELKVGRRNRRVGHKQSEPMNLREGDCASQTTFAVQVALEVKALSGEIKGGAYIATRKRDALSWGRSFHEV